MKVYLIRINTVLENTFLQNTTDVTDNQYNNLSRFMSKKAFN